MGRKKTTFTKIFPDETSKGQITTQSKIDSSTNIWEVKSRIQSIAMEWKNDTGTQKYQKPHESITTKKQQNGSKRLRMKCKVCGELVKTNRRNTMTKNERTKWNVDEKEPRGSLKRQADNWRKRSADYMSSIPNRKKSLRE